MWSLIHLIAATLANSRNAAVTNITRIKKQQSQKTFIALDLEEQKDFLEAENAENDPSIDEKIELNLANTILMTL